MTRVALAAPRTQTVTVRGAEVVVVVNPPISVVADLESRSGDRLIKALSTIVVSHEFDKPDGTPAEVKDFDSELAGEIATAWGEALRALPPASAPTSSQPT